MERLSNAFTHLRARSHSSADGGVQRPVADEWYIPYTGRPSPAPVGREADVTPPPATAPVKSSSHGNLLSVMCGGTMEDDNWERERGGYRREKPSGDARNPAAGVQRLLPKRGNGGSSSNPSYEGGLEVPREPERFPSFTSVPTGLAEENILFSPLNRQMRAAAGGEQSGPARPYAAEYPPVEPRQRTVSAPHPRSQSRRYPREREEEDDPKQWQVASMRELLVLPRPNLLPHNPPNRTAHLTAKPQKRSSLNSFATATTTDDDERVVLDGQARTREREEWAEYVRRRGRSLSLGGQAEPPLGAMPVGNAKARERERSRSRERNRNSSSLSLGGGQGRKRATSFGSKWSHGHSRKSLSLSLSRGGSFSKKEERKDEKRGSFLDMDRGAEDVPGSFGFVKQPGGGGRRDGMPTRGYGASESNLHDMSKRHSDSSNGGKVYGRGQTRSNPDLLNMFAPPGESSGGSSNDSRYPAPVGMGPTRTLQFKQPSVADRGGVVVIARGSSRRAATLGSSARPLAPLDLSKPLPSLPPEAMVTPLPESSVLPSFADEIGLAISPGLRGSGEFANAQSPARGEQVMTPRTPDEEIGVALSPVMRRGESDSGQELEPASERRLSQLSDGGGATGGSANARAFLAKQQQRARMRRAFQSPVQSPAGYRRPSGHTTPLTMSTSSSSGGTSFPAANDSSGLLPSTLPPTPTRADGPRRKTAIEEAIVRNRAASVGVLEAQDKDAQERARSALGERPKSDTPSAPVSATMPLTALSSLASGTAGGVGSRGRPDTGSSAVSASVSMADSRASVTPSMVQDERDFHGLFFRTPHEAYPPTPDVQPHAIPRVPVPPVYPVKLAYGMSSTPPPQQEVLQPDLEDKALAALAEDQIRRSSDGSDGTTVAEVMTPNIPTNQASQANLPMSREGSGMSSVVGAGAGVGLGEGKGLGMGMSQRLMAPFAMEKPIGEREEVLGSGDGNNHLQQVQPSISLSPALPESTTMGNSIPSPIAFPRTRAERPPSQTSQPYLTSRPLSFAHPRTPSQPSRGSFASSPYREFSPSPGPGGYKRDSAAVSFVDDFPSPPTRFTEEGEAVGQVEGGVKAVVRSFGERL
ncbi:hypothetical protein IAT38_000138 [Cryptococcus sp. DSM 104549]